MQLSGSGCSPPPPPQRGTWCPEVSHQPTLEIYAPPVDIRLTDVTKQAAARALSQDKSRPVTQICKMLGISRTSFYRYIND